MAKSLDANLYYGRLSGHGRRHRRGRLGGGGPDGDALAEEADPGALFQDALDAVRVGQSLGERIVLVGMSTGGALVTWLATLPPVKQNLATVVLISPAMALGHPLYPVLKNVFGTLRLLPSFLRRSVRTALICAAVGKIKSSPALSPEHNRFNTLTYPSSALLHLLVSLVG